MLVTKNCHGKDLLHSNVQFFYQLGMCLVWKPWPCLWMVMVCDISIHYMNGWMPDILGYKGKPSSEMVERTLCKSSKEELQSAYGNSLET